MAEQTTIEWTDHTFNTHWGCSKISPGCDGCYAERLAARFGYGWGDDAPKREFSEKHWNELLRWDRHAREAGVRRRVFTNSMSDLFDKFAPDGVRERHFPFIERTPNLDHLLLTKRIGNVERMVPAHWLDGGWPANAWLGISVVNQEEADRDIPKLLRVPARVRFLSIEPMLGPIRLYDDWLYGVGWSRCHGPLDWVIAGGESGPHARPTHPDWFRSLRDQCTAAGVSFLFKQWGEWVPMMGHVEGVPVRGEKFTHRDGTIMGYAGKKAAGRHLDGITHDHFPSQTAPGGPAEALGPDEQGEIHG